MDYQELLSALRCQKVMDNLRCLGCGYAHNCSVHGCVINRAAADLIERLAEENEVLRNPPNEPLTLEELREMDGEPLWVKFPKCPEASGWMLVDVKRESLYSGILGCCSFENLGRTWRAYRRRPEGNVSNLDTSEREEG